LFDVDLTVSNDNGCSASSSETVTVLARPLPQITDLLNGPPFSNCNNEPPPTPSDPDFEILVSNMSPNANCISTYDISWGDGLYSYGLTIDSFPKAHTYLSLGVFDLNVSATGLNGCSNDATYSVINESNPIVNFSNLGGTGGCAPITFNFGVTGATPHSNNSPTTIYEFIWGDGTRDTMNQAWADTATIMQHTYLQSSCPDTNQYIARLIATNNCASTENTTSSIRVSEPPEAVIGTSSTDICINDTICFINNSSMGVAAWAAGCHTGGIYIWDFGDGGTSSDSVPCHTYTNAGHYWVTLTVVAQYCDVSVDSVQLTIIGTHAEFTADTACFGSPTHFTDLSYSYSDSTYTPDPNFPITSWLWDFGDGGTSSLPNPSYTFLNNGYQIVSLTVSNGYGCDSTFIDSVYVDDMQIDSVIVTPVECYNTNTGSIQVYSSLGVGLHTYTLTPGPIVNNTGLFEDLFPGTYLIEIEDEHGCLLDTTITLLNPDTISIISVTSTDITCHDYNNGTITVVGAGGTPPLSYTLQPDGITNSTGFFDWLDAGVYTVMVTDSNLCAAAVTPDITILNPDEIIIDSTHFVDNTCFDTINATISVYASGGTGNLYYTLWPAGTPTQTNNGVFTGLSPGTYFVTVTDDNNCPADTSIDFTVTNPPPISILSVQSTDVSCHDSTNGTITVIASGGTPPLEYTLTPGNIINNTGIFTGLGAGTYSVSVTDSNGCPPALAPNIVIANPDEIQIVSESFTDISCHDFYDGTITVTASGGTGSLHYTLFPDGTLTQTDNGTFTGLGPGTYYVIVTDDNDCPADTSINFILTNPAEILIDTVSFTHITCHDYDDGTITAIASGGTGDLIYTLWPDGTLSQTNNGLFTGLSAGTYFITVTDANGCPADTSINITIVNPPGITIDSESSTDITCHNDDDGTLTIVASGGTGDLSYTLFPDGTLTQINNGYFTGLSAGSYYVEVTDSSNCIQTSNTLIIVNPDEIVIDSTSVTEITCNDYDNGIISVFASGGTGSLHYTLFPDGTLTQTDNGTFTNLAPGTYYVTVTDDNACPIATSGNFILTNPAEILIDTVIYTHISCHDYDDGTITAIASGGTGDLIYTLWPDGTLSQTNNGLFTGLSAGTYVIKVTDFNG